MWENYNQIQKKEQSLLMKEIWNDKNKIITQPNPSPVQPIKTIKAKFQSIIM